jgi:glutamine cyclotransferase
MSTARRRGPALSAVLGMSLLATAALVAACGGTPAAAGASSTGPSAAAGTELRVLDQQAFVDAPQAYRVVPAFGSIWVDQVAGSENDGKTTWVVTRIDPKTSAVVASIPISTTTDGMAATDTSLWVLDGDAQALREIDPKTNKSTGRTIPVGDQGGDLLFANGKLWHVGYDTISSIDPATGAVTHLPMAGGCGQGCGMVVTSDAIYKISDNTLLKLSLDGTKILAKNTTDVAGTALAIGKDGVYAGSPTASVAILDPGTLALKKAISADPAVGSDGTKWSLGNAGTGDIVADDAGAWVRFSPQTVGHVDPAAGTITLYGGPFPSEVGSGGGSNIAVADGSLWVTNVGQGSSGADGGKPGVYRLALPKS